MTEQLSHTSKFYLIICQRRKPYIISVERKTVFYNMQCLFLIKTCSRLDQRILSYMIEIIFLKVQTYLIFMLKQRLVFTTIKNKTASQYHVTTSSLSHFGINRGGIRQMALKMLDSVLRKPTEVGGFRSETRGTC